ncbi:MAG: hypothetical protein INF52_04965 [Rhodobacter sp.]|nr:hypothetical protein [Rhodobacter sp.]
MNEGQKTVRSEYRQLQERRAYFLLAAAGAAIGFVITQFDPARVISSFYFMLFALAALGASFAAGMAYVNAEEQILYANSLFLDLAGEQQTSAELAFLRKTADKASFDPLAKKKRWFGTLQLWLLFIGGLLVPIWKIADCNACLSLLALKP